ncbi:methionine--tRNA ligase [Limibacillus sp. MBR-115]|jgi:methionyl-tRNA synthetase|uniref:methionine--tRNA ligase n=1 Tax=Limibacillus sp. MBR-115 TaxID=3156465 RepID=UPI003393CFC1
MARILITSALPYINGVKHLGNLVGSMLPGDVYARFMRMRGHDVLYICATDEHGTPAELAALEAGQSVEEYCREQHTIQAAIGARFQLSFDHFGRSSSPQNAELTQHFCKKLDEHGHIEERTISQVYSVDDARYLPDRYIVGTCPHCSYERARGDQCENCTRLLEPTDLIDARSAVSGSKNLEVRETKHLFLLQSSFVDQLRSWINSKHDWPNLVRSIALKWLDEGLHDRCITRDLSWGVPVDRPGFEGKVFYVWFDAPIEYIGATKEWADLDPENRDWRSWWDGKAKDLRYLQFMAKDNVPFHTVSFPCTLFGSGEDWKAVDFIKGFNWLTYYGGKFSTSQKRGIFMDMALEEFPSDYYRYWLMANAPEGSDSSFTWQSFVDGINKDLADVLGNFVNRTLKFTTARFGDTVPDGGTWGAAEAKLASGLERLISSYAENMEAVQVRKALSDLRAIWVLGNEYLTDAAPWTTIKTDRDQAAVSVRTAINLIRLFATLAHPVIPENAGKLLESLGLEDNPEWPGRAIREELTAIKAGQPFQVPPILFEKVPAERVAELMARYGGE